MLAGIAAATSAVPTRATIQVSIKPITVDEAIDAMIGRARRRISRSPAREGSVISGTCRDDDRFCLTSIGSWSQNLSARSNKGWRLSTEQNPHPSPLLQAGEGEKDKEQNNGRVPQCRRGEEYVRHQTRALARSTGSVERSGQGHLLCEKTPLPARTPRDWRGKSRTARLDRADDCPGCCLERRAPPLYVDRATLSVRAPSAEPPFDPREH